MASDKKIQDLLQQHLANVTHSNTFTDSKSGSFEDALLQLVNFYSPNASDRQIREEMLVDIQDVLDKGFPSPTRLRAEVYGSWLSGLYSYMSDLDVALYGEVSLDLLPAHIVRGMLLPPGAISVRIEVLDRQACMVVLRRVAEAFENSRLTNWGKEEVERVLTARVPIIKMRDVQRDVCVDVCCGTPGKAAKHQVIGHLTQLNPRLEQLFRLVKVFAKVHSLNDSANATFNTWCLTLMTVFALQQAQPAMLPPLALPLEGGGPDARFGPRLLSMEDRVGSHGLTSVREMTEYVDLKVSECEGWCKAAAASGLYSASWSLTSTLSWFLTLMGGLMEDWHAGRARSLRVSVYQGARVHGAFSKKYLVGIEDPFNNEDNPARTVGSTTRHNDTLPHITHSFLTGARLMRAMRNGGTHEMHQALVYLFGSEGLLSLSRKGVPKGLGVPEAWVHGAEAAWDNGGLQGSCTWLMGQVGLSEEPLTPAQFWRWKQAKAQAAEVARQARAQEAAQKRAAEAARQARTQEAARQQTNAAEAAQRAEGQMAEGPAHVLLTQQNQHQQETALQQWISAQARGVQQQQQLATQRQKQSGGGMAAPPGFPGPQPSFSRPGNTAAGAAAGQAPPVGAAPAKGELAARAPLYVPPGMRAFQPGQAGQGGVHGLPEEAATHGRTVFGSAPSMPSQHGFTAPPHLHALQAGPGPFVNAMSSPVDLAGLVDGDGSGPPGNRQGATLQGATHGGQHPGASHLPGSAVASGHASGVKAQQIGARAAKPLVPPGFGPVAGKAAGLGAVAQTKLAIQAAAHAMQDLKVGQQ